MLTYRAAGALAIEDDGDFDADLADEMQGLRDSADDEIQTRLHIPDAEELPDAVRGKYYSEIGWRVLRQHPRAAAMLTLRGLLVNIFDSRWEGLEIVSRFPTDIVRRSLDAFTAALFVFAVDRRGRALEARPRSGGDDHRHGRLLSPDLRRRRGRVTVPRSGDSAVHDHRRDRFGRIAPEETPRP